MPSVGTEAGQLTGVPTRPGMKEWSIHLRSVVMRSFSPEARIVAVAEPPDLRRGSARPAALDRRRRNYRVHTIARGGAASRCRPYGPQRESHARQCHSHDAIRFGRDRADDERDRRLRYGSGAGIGGLIMLRAVVIAAGAIPARCSSAGGIVESRSRPWAHAELVLEVRGVRSRLGLLSADKGAALRRRYGLAPHFAPQVVDREGAGERR